MKNFPAITFAISGFVTSNIAGLRGGELMFYSNFLKTFFVSLATVICLLLTVEARAMVMWEVDGGKLTGAKNVNVNGIFYDVTFGDGNCTGLFGGCDNANDDFTFTTQDDAKLAADALLLHVLIDAPIEGSPLAFDADPTLTSGCTTGGGNGTGCNILIPYDIAVSIFPFFPLVQTVSAHNNQAEGADEVRTSNSPQLQKDGLTSISDPNQLPPVTTPVTYAQFTPTNPTLLASSVPVIANPIPPAMLLFGSGVVALFGLAGIRRRRQRQI